MNNFPGRPPPQFRTPYSNEQGHHYPPDTPQQPHRYFRVSLIPSLFFLILLISPQDDSSTMVSSQSSFATTNNDATPPMFDPRRFSPPQLDTPPANQVSIRRRGMEEETNV